MKKSTASIFPIILLVASCASTDYASTQKRDNSSLVYGKGKTSVQSVRVSERSADEFALDFLHATSVTYKRTGLTSLKEARGLFVGQSFGEWLPESEPVFVTTIKGTVHPDPISMSLEKDANVKHEGVVVIRKSDGMIVFATWR